MKSLPLTSSFARSTLSGKSIGKLKPIISKKKLPKSERQTFKLAETSWLRGLISESRFRVLAIDPGLSGAVVLIGEGDLQVRRDFKKDEDISQAVRELAPGALVCCIEHVHSKLGDGIKSAFSFGKFTGIAKGALHAFFKDPGCVLEPSPQKWQFFIRKELRVLPMSGPDKVEFNSLDLCRQLLPDRGQLFKRKLDHNTADAVLIGAYCLALLA